VVVFGVDWIQIYAVAVFFFGFISSMVKVVKTGQVDAFYWWALAVACCSPLYGRIFGWW
jgi:hypothetical protein